MTPRSLFTVPALCLALLTATAQDSSFKRTEDVIYGRKFGTALTLDVFQPTRTPNGCAVIFMVSGGWFSAKTAVSVANYRPFLDRGYTVFAVVHGSQPKFTIPEITQDIHRAVRFIRANAAQWGVNPDKLGITGGSAGGHLSLTMGTQGRAGDPNAKDAVERSSSVVLVVKDAPEGVRGDSANNVQKQITLETGISINAPLFIKTGERIRVDTRSGKYMERA